MINILHIINGWPSGGITEQVYLLCKYLPKDQFKQYSIGYSHFDGAFVKKFEDVGVECIHSDKGYSNLQDIIREKDIHIVHKQTGGGDYPSYVPMLKEMGIPLIESIYCPRATAIPVDEVSKITYTTPYTLSKNKDEHYSKMYPIQYALDIESPIVDCFSKKDKDHIIVGRLGRVVPDKRPDILLKLARLSYEKFGDKIQFHLAGVIPQDFPLHIEYGKRFVKLCQKIPNVKYFGYVEDKYDFWKTLDICINPVWETSFDIVFLEAMACGIPILTWNNSAAIYVVGEAGIVAKESLQDMFLGLCKLYSDYGMRMSMGETGIQYIKNKYSLKKYIDEHVKLYRSVCGKIDG